MKPSVLLQGAHISMATTFLMALLVLYIIYGAKLALSTPVLIFFHILFVLLAAIFKISYVTRLAALKQMGKQAH